MIIASDSGLYLCIGEKDGATDGQVLDVYKIAIQGDQMVWNPFKRENKWKVRITDIVDDHFAKAAIISGKAELNSIVELPSPG